MIHQYLAGCFGSRRKRGKGIVPKGYDAADYILGHRVKNHMTVISEDGALSEAERVGKFL